MNGIPGGYQTLILASRLGSVPWSGWSVVEGSRVCQGEDKVGGQCEQQPHKQQPHSVITLFGCLYTHSAMQS